ncbi:hypothetical protein SRHO_G00203550 [Serrasalmus rhombeus]
MPQRDNIQPLVEERRSSNMVCSFWEWSASDESEKAFPGRTLKVNYASSFCMDVAVETAGDWSMAAFGF